MALTTTRICVVRHGETAWNAEGRIQGELDVPLSAVGHAQARAVANALAGEDFAAIYSSDLGRARHTAEATAHLRRQPINLVAALRERHYGVFQGLTYEEAQRRHPEEFAGHRRRDPDLALGDGESLRQLEVRITTCFARLAARHAGGQILAFTHGGVLDVLHRRATGAPLTSPRDFEIPNAALNWIELADDGRWSILVWADRDHLLGARDEL